MKRAFVLGILMVLFVASTSYSFDGYRKGFVLGGGLGLVPSASWSFEFTIPGNRTFKVDESKTGVGGNFIIGYGWDEHNMIVYEGNVAAYNSDVDNTQIGQGFNGAAWYHYFGPVGKSFFTVGGLGFYVFKPQDFKQNDPGLGFLAGIGYEFARHVQVAGYVSAGKTSDSGIDFNHSHIGILVSAVAF